MVATVSPDEVVRFSRYPRSELVNGLSTLLTDPPSYKRRWARTTQAQADKPTRTDAVQHGRVRTLIR